MRSGESFSGAPDPTTLVTANSARFQLLGGKYWFGAVGTFNGATIAFQRIGPDSNSPITVGTALTTAGGNTSDLPPGSYQVTLTSGTTAAIYWEVVRVPEE